MILEKSRQKVTGCEVALEGEREAIDPEGNLKVFTKVHMVFTLTGRDLNPAQVERAIKLSEEKYCSASAMFRHTAEITSEWRVVQAV